MALGHGPVMELQEELLLLVLQTKLLLLAIGIAMNGVIVLMELKLEFVLHLQQDALVLILIKPAEPVLLLLLLMVSVELLMGTIIFILKHLGETILNVQLVLHLLQLFQGKAQHNLGAVMD
jgi:hypothetical protein